MYYVCNKCHHSISVPACTDPSHTHVIYWSVLTCLCVGGPEWDEPLWSASRWRGVTGGDGRNTKTCCSHCTQRHQTRCHSHVVDWEIKVLYLIVGINDTPAVWLHFGLCRQRLSVMRTLNEKAWNSPSSPVTARSQSPQLGQIGKDPFYDRYPWIRLIGRSVLCSNAQL